MDLLTPNPSNRPRRILAAVPVALLHAGVVAGGLRLAVGGEVWLWYAVATAAASLAMTWVVGAAMGRPFWAAVFALAGAVSGWLFVYGAVTALDLTGPPRAWMLASALVGSTVLAALLGVWALRGACRWPDALALAALAGFPVLASQWAGCLQSTWMAALAPAVLVAAMACEMAWQRRRMKRRPPALPAIHPARTNFGPEHYVLLVVFAGIELVMLPALLRRDWLNLPRLGPGALARPSNIHWLCLAAGALAWLLLWVAARPGRRRPSRSWPAGDQGIPGNPWMGVPRGAGSPVGPTGAQGEPIVALSPVPGADPPPPPPMPASVPLAQPVALPRPPRDAGWLLIAASAQFTITLELVAFHQVAYETIPGLTELAILATVLMGAIVLILLSTFSFSGRARFNLFSILYALALLTALAGTLLALWTQQLAMN